MYIKHNNRQTAKENVSSAVTDLMYALRYKLNPC